MRSGLLKVMVIVAGLLAMLSGLHAPEAAGPWAHHEDTHLHLHVRSSEAPCCADKGAASLKLCGQHCAAIATASFLFMHLPSVKALDFQSRHRHSVGLSYRPLAPPPR
ncbi:MAG: hypothetical protein LDL37_11260 [Asticcacaulis sp.]|uniref:hypothetical protein n=1 Tax=Asticcacaulis sp. TaxID=1872648 RepID=UPI0025BEC2E6|nr:hypothetical protein [Asticcacaulis sp.]MCA1936026.1 hypothetical protein [Asticcacaulis sp.]